MSTNVIMPQMGESIAEGTITKWLKQPGDAVDRDEPLFEISTDKVDAEIPSPAAGVLLEIKVPEGETVEVNTVVGLIGAAGEKAAPGAAPSPAPKPGSPAATTPAPAAAPAHAPAAATAPAFAPAPASASPVPAARTAAVEKPYDRYSPEELRRARSSPVVRKIAAEHGVDITEVNGSGVSGRVTKQDILAHIESGVPARPVPARPGAPAAAPAPGLGVAIPDLKIPAYQPGEPVAIEPMSVMRRKIAEHMVYSQTVSAHVTSFFEIDFEAVAAQRRAQKSEFAARGVHLTYLPFVIRAVVEGLKKYPYLNASVMGDQIVFKQEINIGIAVALEDGKGLIVPVIRNADHLNLLGLAKAVNNLGERARTRQLTPDDVQRGTFSITNPGVYGGLMGTPIINQPQVAILGVGAIEKRPVVINDAIAIRHRSYFALSYDHRLVDGAMAELFMAGVKAFLEAGNIQ